MEPPAPGTYRVRPCAAAFACLGVAVLGTVLALARPRWGSQPGRGRASRRRHRLPARLLASMGAADVLPSRLWRRQVAGPADGARCPATASAWCRRRGGGRPGAADARRRGHRPAARRRRAGVAAVARHRVRPRPRRAPSACSRAGNEKHRVLVILSDGEDHGGGLAEKIARLREDGVVVHAFGIGTPKGAPLPVPGGGFKHDEEGNVVMSHLHEDVLENMTRATGGSYTRVTSAAARSLRGGGEDRQHGEADRGEPERDDAGGALPVAARPRRGGSPLLSRRQPVHAAGGIMPKLLPVLLLAGSAVSALPSLPSLSSLPWAPHLPAWAERWLYNPRERTESAIAAVGKKDTKAARSAADTALRLAPQDPLARYNDGTAHLLAGDRRGAVPLLERAAKGRRGGPLRRPVPRFIRFDRLLQPRQRPPRRRRRRRRGRGLQADPAPGAPRRRRQAQPGDRPARARAGEDARQVAAGG